MVKALLLFDIDGVVRDVGNSYRRAVVDTVNHYSGWEPESSAIDALKSEGLWNNDWDCSMELLRRRRESDQPDLVLPEYDALVHVFSGFYFGATPDGKVSEDPATWTGHIKNEPLLVDKAYFEALTAAEVAYGFVSGAE